jgi:hypothetical protein
MGTEFTSTSLTKYCGNQQYHRPTRNKTHLVRNTEASELPFSYSFSWRRQQYFETLFTGSKTAIYHGSVVSPVRMSKPGHIERVDREMHGVWSSEAIKSDEIWHSVMGCLLPILWSPSTPSWWRHILSCMAWLALRFEKWRRGPAKTKIGLRFLRSKLSSRPRSWQWKDLQACPRPWTGWATLRRILNSAFMWCRVAATTKQASDEACYAHFTTLLMNLLVFSSRCMQKRAS